MNVNHNLVIKNNKINKNPHLPQWVIGRINNDGFGLGAERSLQLRSVEFPVAGGGCARSP